MVASFSVLFNQASAGGIRSEHPVAVKHDIVRETILDLKMSVI